MPIYEYHCAACDQVFEAMQRITADPLETCRRDGCEGDVRRLISRNSFKLKGSGWYVTDYGKGGSAGTAGSEESSSTEKSSSSSSGSDDAASAASSSADD